MITRIQELEDPLKLSNAARDVFAGRIRELEAALYGAAESLASFRPHPLERTPVGQWTELDEVTLFDAQRLCGKYPTAETKDDQNT